MTSSELPPVKYSKDGSQWWDGHRWLPVGRLKPVRRPRVLVVILLSAIIIGLALFLLNGVFILSQVAFEVEKKSLSEASGPRNLQVCSSTEFDNNHGSCSTNRVNQSFQTTHLMCATQLAAAAPTVSSALLYQGQEVVSQTLQPSGGGGKSFSFGYSLGNRQLPGGDWSCRFSLGSLTQEAKFKLQGPTGTLLYPAVCDNSHEEPTNGAPLCQQSVDKLTSPTEIVCSDVIFGNKGKEVEVELNYTGDSAPHFSRSSAGTATTALFPNLGAFAPSDVGQPGPTMPSGSYNCTWKISGHQVGSKNFSVQ